MFDNPLIQRYRFSLMRPLQFWLYVTMYVVLVAILFFLNYSAYKYTSSYMTLTELFKSIYYQLFIFQLLILAFWGAYNSGTAIRDEIIQKSYDFFRMLPIPSVGKTLGILIGKNLVVLLFAAINCILLFFAGFKGSVNFTLQLQILLLVISVALLFNTAALLTSVNPQKKKKSSPIGFIILAFIFLPYGIGLVAAMPHTKDLEIYPAWFYELKVPVLVLISFICLYFTCWTFTGILRKFTKEDQPLFTRTGAILFMLGYLLVLVGLFFHHLSALHRELLIAQWVITLIPVLLIPLVAERSFDDYLEHCGLLQSRPTPRKPGLATLLPYSNLSLALILFAMWAAGAAWTSFVSKVDIYQSLRFILILFSYYLFFALLFELYVVCRPLSGKIGLFLVFVALVYCVLPLILSAVMDSEIVYVYSPAGCLFDMGSSTPKSDQLSIQVSILLINALLCVTPVMIILKRYKHIITTRENM